jgi:hypothetical protein
MIMIGYRHGVRATEIADLNGRGSNWVALSSLEIETA